MLDIVKNDKNRTTWIERGFDFYMRSGNKMIKSDNLFHKQSWLTALKAISTLSIILHHWLHMVPQKDNFLFKIVGQFSGTFINLFFVISGCGLTISVIKSKEINLKSFYFNRFYKIVVPYWYVIIMMFFIFKVFSYYSVAILPQPLNWNILLPYFLFTRNFDSDVHYFNPTHWFMPVIVGLYLLFPLLHYIMRRVTSIAFLLIALLCTIFSIIFLDLNGYYLHHRTAIAPFYIFEFSFGMFLANYYILNNIVLRRNTYFCLSIIGIFLYGLAWYMAKKWQWGGNYNDIFTTLGLFFIIIGPTIYLFKKCKVFILKFLEKINEEGYFMYLIHAPFLLYVIAPNFTSNNVVSPISSLLWFVIFTILIYYSSKMLRNFYETVSLLSLKILHVERNGSAIISKDCANK